METSCVINALTHLEIHNVSSLRPGVLSSALTSRDPISWLLADPVIAHRILINGTDTALIRFDRKHACQLLQYRRESDYKNQKSWRNIWSPDSNRKQRADTRTPRRFVSRSPARDAMTHGRVRDSHTRDYQNNRCFQRDKVTSRRSSTVVVRRSMTLTYGGHNQRPLNIPDLGGSENSIKSGRAPASEISPAAPTIVVDYRVIIN